MSAQNASPSAPAPDFLSLSRPNGAGAASILAAGCGAFLLAVLAILADQSAAIKSLMIFSKQLHLNCPDSLLDELFERYQKEKRPLLPATPGIY